jgi:dolichol-phosphate mannosyltransferase
MNTPLISVIIPVFRCGDCLKILCERIRDAVSGFTNDYEVILVNDASPDESWRIIKTIANHDKHVIGVNLSRNFGQHYAITAGLDMARGEWIVVMDCDLQDQPEEITKLYEKAKQGYEIVLGKRHDRKDSFIKEYSSIIFYKILSYLTDNKQNHQIANFGIYSRKVIDAIKSMRENLRYFPVLVRWTGFKTAEIDIEHAKRLNGKTSYSFSKLFNLAFNIVIEFSDKPLRVAVKLGLFISLLSVIYALIVLVRVIIGNVTVEGWSSLIISVWFLSGLIIFIMGITGIYIGKTFDEVKKRPIYIVSETTDNR